MMVGVGSRHAIHKVWALLQHLQAHLKAGVSATMDDHGKKHLTGNSALVPPMRTYLACNLTADKLKSTHNNTTSKRPMRACLTCSFTADKPTHNITTNKPPIGTRSVCHITADKLRRTCITANKLDLQNAWYRATARTWRSCTDNNLLHIPQVNMVKSTIFHQPRTLQRMVDVGDHLSMTRLPVQTSLVSPNVISLARLITESSGNSRAPAEAIFCMLQTHGHRISCVRRESTFPLELFGLVRFHMHETEFTFDSTSNWNLQRCYDIAVTEPSTLRKKLADKNLRHAGWSLSKRTRL